MQEGLATLPVGSVIRDRYIVKSVIGKGNSGAVYLVKDQHAKRAAYNHFALKEVIGLSKQERHHFTLAGAPLRQLKHQALPHFYQVFNDDESGRVYILMDYIEGPDLETLWQQQPEQRFSWSEVTTIMAPIIDAVSYLHQQEPPITHGDIKPVNIIVAQPGDRSILVDFGLARTHNLDFIAPALPNSSPDYRATELSSGSTGVRIDISGLGVTFYTLLTGIVPNDTLSRDTPSDSKQANLLVKSANVVAPTVPVSVSEVIQRAMSRRANEGFSSVELFWQALQAAPKELTPTVPDTEPPTPDSTLIASQHEQTVPHVPTPSLQQQLQVERPPVFFSRKLALFLLVLTLLIGTGLGSWSLVQSHFAASTGLHRSVSTATGPVTLTPGGSVSISTPTSAPGNYPSVAGAYAGTLVDLASKASTTIILQGIHQIKGNISGYLTMGSRFQGSGAFSGTIDFSKNFRFTVRDAAGHPMLFFEGSIQTMNSLSGDFYSCMPSQKGECMHAQASYGIWSALLV